MKIKYNNKLDEITHDEKSIIKAIGPELAKMYIKRINQLESSSNFYDYKELRIGNPHPLVGDLDDCYGINLSSNIRLCVKPLTNDLSNNGLKICDEVEVKGVLEYHGNKKEWLLR